MVDGSDIKELKDAIERLEHNFQHEGRRRTTQEIRFQQDTDRSIKRVKGWIGLALAVTTTFGGAIGWLVQRYDTQAALLQECETRHSAAIVAGPSVGALQKHITEQAKINVEQRIRSIRVEMMFEQLLEKAGKKPPDKRRIQEDADIR